MNVELHAFADDWELTANQTLALHALADDWSLTANADHSREHSITMTVEYYLTDQAGNFLVDQAGNYLVFIGSESVTPMLLHALNDDFNLNG